MTRLHLHSLIAILLCVAVLMGSASADDVVVLKTGSRVTGKVITYDATTVNIEAKVGSRSVTRKYPASQIKSLTIDGVGIDLSLRIAFSRDQSIKIAPSHSRITSNAELKRQD